MATISDISVQVDRATIEKEVRDAADLTIAVRASEVGAEMARRATQLMADAGFNLNRPYERRRHPGSRRAANAISYERVRNGPGNYTVSYKILGGAVVEARIAGLNYGIGSGHTITPTGNWPLKDATLFRRSGSKAGRASNPDVLAWLDAGSDVVTPRVKHKGMKRWPNGAGFLESARDEVVDSLR